MGRGRKIAGAVILLLLLGSLASIFSGQISFGEGIVILFVLVVFVMPGLINLTR